MSDVLVEKSVGKPLNRVDGHMKVTGGAHYSADMPMPDALYGVLVTSTAAPGQITSMDTTAAEAVPGVVKIITPMNALRLPQQPGEHKDRPQDRRLQVFQDNAVYYQNQPIGLALADTFERAAHAASLVKVQYQTTPPHTALEEQISQAFAPESVNGEPPDSNRGNPEDGMQQAAAKLEQIYTTPVENHNPMEPHATLAYWEQDHLTIYDATQGIFGDRSMLAKTFALEPENVRVVCYFLGGGFGCKGSPWSHVVIAALAAKQVGRPVKLVLTRAQMYGPVGYRPRTQQHLSLGALSDGTLTNTEHHVFSQTSQFDIFVEPSSLATRILYETPNEATSQRLVRLDVGTPTFMRAPGEASGTFAIESAMDELADMLKMDPIAFRDKNYAEKDPESGKPWSSKSLRECYRLGAEKFGWNKRSQAPGSMTTTDGLLVGWGAATATYPVNRSASSALARLMPDGTAYVLSGTQDLGTGTYTVMTQVAADALGMVPDQVRFELGDTTMPQTPVSGGSQTAASTGTAVRKAGLAARAQAIALAIGDPGSPLHGLSQDGIGTEAGRMISIADPTKGETYADLIKRQGLLNIEAKTEAKPEDDAEDYSKHSFGAVFTEVQIDPDIRMIHVTRCVGVYGVGNILNAKTARSQLLGGIVFGIGMALMEETVTDPRFGRVMNADLAEYLVPVNADVPEIDVTFVPESDYIINPLGVKGIGEIGITGVTASLANAVYHATGRRVRDLPVRLDKIL